MAGFGGKLLLASVFVLGTASSARAWWGWWSYPAYYRPSYYAPVYYVYPAYPICVSVPRPAPAPAPVPALKPAAKTSPSTGKEPPALTEPIKKGPVITESRSQSGGCAQAASGALRCKVGFWNLTGRDVTLIVGGQQRTLPKDRAVTLDLDRAFAWQIDQREAVTERVPEGGVFHEVILRD